MIQKYFGKKIVIFSNMYDLNRLKLSFIPTLLILAFLLGSCKTTKVGALEYHRPSLGVNYNNHQTIYTFSPDTLFKDKATSQLDAFDLVFFDNLENQLTARSYVVGAKGQLQTVNLEQCILSIEHKEQMASAMFACKTTLIPDSIFYSYTSLFIGNNKLDEHTNKKLAAQLARETAKSIDSLHLKQLISKDPEKYTATYKKREASSFGNGLLLFLVVIVLLYI